MNDLVSEYQQYQEASVDDEEFERRKTCLKFGIITSSSTLKWRPAHLFLFSMSKEMSPAK